MICCLKTVPKVLPSGILMETIPFFLVVTFGVCFRCIMVKGFSGKDIDGRREDNTTVL